MTGTVIDIIKKAEHLEKCNQQRFIYDRDLFIHPFNTEILINCYEDKLSSDIVKKILDIGKCAEKQLVSQFTKLIPEQLSIYSLTQEVKSRLKEMFIEPRLSIEVKPGSSTDRKMSCTSEASSKRTLPCKRSKLKSRKMSDLDSELASQISLGRKRVSIDTCTNKDKINMPHDHNHRKSKSR